MDSKQTTFYLGRHGETDWNVEKRTQGQSNEPKLTEKGFKQSEEMAEMFANVAIDLIYASDLRRTMQTAEVIAKKKGIKVIPDSRFRERFFGKYQGRFGSEWRGELKERLLEVENLEEKDKWTFKIDESVESDAEVLRRFMEGLNEIAQKNLGKKILIVTHGGPIRFFLLHLGFAKYGELNFKSVENGGYVQTKYIQGKFSIEETVGVDKVK